MLDRRRMAQVTKCLSVDPGDGDPLSRGGHQVNSLLQQADGVVDLVVNDGLVEVVSVGPLQHLRFLLEPLEWVVLSGKTPVSDGMLHVLDVIELRLIQVFKIIV